MPNEKDTLASRRDALDAYESLFGDAEPGADDAGAEEQDARTETVQVEQGSEVAGEGAGAKENGASEDKAADDKTGSPEDLKVVVSIKDGRATVGVQRPSSDPYIESFDDPDIRGAVGEVTAVLDRAAAKWEEAPKYPAHARPEQQARRRPRRERAPAQDSTEEGEAAQPQQETLKLF